MVMPEDERFRPFIPQRTAIPNFLPTRRGQEDDCHFKYSPEEDMKGLIDF
jgi:hypothetical protein